MSDPVAANASNATTISATDSAVAYCSLYLMALFCIYVGSFRSLYYVNKQKEEGKKIENSISTKEARRFPFMASGVLFGLYVFFKYGERIRNEKLSFFSNIYKGINATVANATLNATTDAANATATAASTFGSYIPELSKRNVMLVLLVLLCWEGCIALSQLLKPAISRLLYALPFLPHDGQIKQNLPYELRFTRAKSKGSEEQVDLLHWEFDTHDLVAALMCLPVGVLHIVYRHWITNNVIGLSFCLFGIEELHLASFKGGALLLAGLFVYDIFWVFATDVMTTVATGINAPILLMFPQDLMANGVLAANKHAMLGLGDIVIPGIFLALLLRFDKAEQAKGAKSRFYFYATVVAYALGLVLTIGVMHWFKAAQPALLYLVPACLGCPLLLSAVRGETNALWTYSEEHLMKTDEDDKKKAE